MIPQRPKHRRCDLAPGSARDWCVYLARCRRPARPDGTDFWAGLRAFAEGTFRVGGGHRPQWRECPLLLGTNPRVDLAGPWWTNYDHPQRPGPPVDLITGRSWGESCEGSLRADWGLTPHEFLRGRGDEARTRWVPAWSPTVKGLDPLGGEISIRTW
jgi:hypothetical protein